MRELKSGDCQGKCDWHREGEQELEGQPLFACDVCGSEWVPSEKWTPRNADGEVAPAVQAARGQAGGSQGSAGSW